MEMLFSAFSSLALTGEDTPSRLLSHVRARVAGCRLSPGFSGMFAVEGGNLSLPSFETLFRAVSRRCDAASLSASGRFLLCDALYALARESGRPYDAVTEGVCDAVLLGLLEEHSPCGTPRLSGEDVVSACCLCLEDFFSPGGWEDDPWYVFLRSTLSSWQASQSPDGSWEGLSPAQAWRRLAVLNRYSYLFLDPEFDGAALRGYACYKDRFLQSPSSLLAVGSLLDAVLPGHLFPRCSELESEADARLRSLCSREAAGSDAYLYGCSYRLSLLSLRASDDFRSGGWLHSA